MADIWGSVISSLGNIGGGLLNMFGQNNANSMNQSNMLQQQQWAEHMAATAYQRTMQDMRAAGLNPILAYQKGPTSVPGVSMPDMKNPLGGFQDIGTSAVQGYKAGAEADVAKEQQAKIAADTDLSKTSADLNRASAVKVVQDTATSAAQARQADAQARLAMENSDNAAATRIILGHQANSARSQADIDARTAEDAQKWGVSKEGSIAASVERATRRAYSNTVPPVEDLAKKGLNNLRNFLQAIPKVVPRLGPGVPDPTNPGSKRKF